MSQWKRLLYYLMINVIVSACTVLIVLTLWERRNNPAQPVLLPDTETQARSSSPPASGTPGTPIALIQATLTPTPAENLLENVEEYQVQFGDTLGIIAEQFDVSVEELLRVNQINDPNSLSVGMVIYIPIPPEKIPTHTPSPSPTLPPSFTGVPGEPLPEARVVINSVIGSGDLATERVFLTRSGFGELNLAGWQLRDQNNNVFTFPQLQLYEGGAVNVWSTSGSPTVVDLYWGLQSPVWSQGETVTLLDAQGEERATYIVP
jgi:LysM repeat protein